MFLRQRNTNNMKTITKQDKGKIIFKNQKKVIFTQQELHKKNQIHVNEKSPKKALMKTLFISKLSLQSVSTFNNEKIYVFTADAFKTIFYIKENINTQEKVLYQDSFILDKNTSACNILLNSLSA